VLLAISAQTVALASVLASLIVGLAATIGLIFNTWFAKRSERESRIWDRKSRAYVTLLWYAQRSMLDVERTYPLKGPAWGKPLGLLPDEKYLEISAEVGAFGTTTVLVAQEKFSAGVRAFFGRVDEMREDEERDSAEMDLDELDVRREEVRGLRQSLEELVRAELAHRVRGSPEFTDRFWPRSSLVDAQRRGFGDRLPAGHGAARSGRPTETRRAGRKDALGLPCPRPGELCRHSLTA
jgi:hypothetical protein